MIKHRFDGLKINTSRESLKLYALNLREPIIEIIPNVAIEVTVHKEPLDFDLIPRTTMEQRCSKGDRIFVCLHQSKPIAYLFATTKNCWVEEIDDWLMISPEDVYLYDAFTIAEYRGKRVYSFLLTSAARFFMKTSHAYALIFTSVQNMRSIKGIERAGFRSYETVDFYNFFGWKCWNYKVKNKDVKSRLSNEV